MGRLARRRPRPSPVGGAERLERAVRTALRVRIEEMIADADEVSKDPTFAANLLTATVYEARYGVREFSEGFGAEPAVTELFRAEGLGYRTVNEGYAEHEGLELQWRPGMEASAPARVLCGGEIALSRAWYFDMLADTVAPRPGAACYEEIGRRVAGYFSPPDGSGARPSPAESDGAAR